MANEFWWKLSSSEEEQGRLWELYHQNSRITRYDKPITREELQEKTLDLIISNDYEEYPKRSLVKELSSFSCSLSEAMIRRATARNIAPVDLSFQELSTLLFYGYGVTRTNEDNDFPHPFRTVPSAGGLYPLEIFFHQNYVPGLDAGLYHFNPVSYEIAHLIKADQTRKIQQFLVQPDVAQNASVLIFICAQFGRNAFKYGERGYRFTHLEAGHVAQNINLTAQGLGLATINIGGYIDRKADEFLRLDGVTGSCLYIVGVGKEKT